MRIILRTEHVDLMRMDGDMSAPARREEDTATLDEIKNWGATVSVPRASLGAYGFSPSHGYELVAAGQFPARVIKAGGRLRVVTASIVASLETP
ncbi:DNA-binding protein [Pseudonocardia parietis]|uniref:dUTP diphosphatase n=1 Tax=Pseudonocardia parietis TaxID=570936 RepID=A0ABS4W3C4_9PSEU|nr:DNA-binding protein [Pseudonocardia parietis]MBP2370695.1 hypothetical protein [Pseudonocardia parietis]